MVAALTDLSSCQHSDAIADCLKPGDRVRSIMTNHMNDAERNNLSLKGTLSTSLMLPLI